MNKDILTRAQAADYIGISHTMLRKFALTDNNSGPPMVKLGYKTVRYQRQQLDEWLRARGAQPELFSKNTD